MKSKKHVVGLDPSLSSFGVAIITRDGLSTARIQTAPRSFEGQNKTKLDSRITRLEYIVRNVLDYVVPARPKLIAIEGYSYAAKNSRSIISLAELGGALRRELVAIYPVVEISPAVLKKFATGRGNADKAAVRVAIFKRWKFEAPDDDQADAFVLAKIAQAAIDRPTAGKLAGFQKTIIAELELPQEIKPLNA